MRIEYLGHHYPLAANVVKVTSLDVSCQTPLLHLSEMLNHSEIACKSLL